MLLLHLSTDTDLGMQDLPDYSTVTGGYLFAELLSLQVCGKHPSTHRQSHLESQNPHD